jgi:hypothetical protein
MCSTSWFFKTSESVAIKQGVPGTRASVASASSKSDTIQASSTVSSAEQATHPSAPTRIARR